MEKKTIEVSVVIPAYNEEASIASVVKGVHTAMAAVDGGYEVVVIDDCSQDSTKKKAALAGARVVTRPYNMGNGAAIKTGIRQARGEKIVFMDGDGQHNPDDILVLLEKLEQYDMVVGARTNKSDTDLHRNFANGLYNGLASYVCGRKIEDLTSGFRAVSAEIAREFIHLLPNTFSYPTTITLAVVRSGYSLVYVPIAVSRRVGKSKISLVRDGLRFLLIIFKVTTLFSPMKIFVPVSVMMFLLGISYGLVKIIFFGMRYGPTSAMLMTVSVLVFLIGLVSEQITQLRYERRNDDREG